MGLNQAQVWLKASLFRQIGTCIWIVYDGLWPCLGSQILNRPKPLWAIDAQHLIIDSQGVPQRFCFLLSNIWIRRWCKCNLVCAFTLGVCMMVFVWWISGSFLEVKKNNDHVKPRPQRKMMFLWATESSAVGPTWAHLLSMRPLW